MSTCLNCQKQIEQKDETRRKKKFCDSNCRASYHQKKNAGKKKYVRIETYQQLEEMNKKLVEQIEKSNLPPLPKKTNYTQGIIKTVEKKEVEKIRHRLFKEGDPPENTNAFFLRKGCFTYDELEKLK